MPVINTERKGCDVIPVFVESMHVLTDVILWNSQVVMTSRCQDHIKPHTKVVAAVVRYL